jgi:nucleoside-diphosphate-sugar epimerase
MTVERITVIDGSNGFVGSNFARRLADAGDEVVGLTRCESASFRAIRHAVVNESRTSDSVCGRISIVPYELTALDLGLDSRGLAKVFARPCDYWHFAAMTNLTSGNRGVFGAVNVEGTARSLEAYARYAQPGSRFFLVSTVYACGLMQGRVMEDWHPAAEPSAFRNMYEWSKREAELAIKAPIEAGELAGAIVRLGQIVGNSRTGETTTTYGLYELIRALGRIAYRRPFEEVRIQGEANAGVALVPIDECVEWLVRLRERDLSLPAPPIFHLVERADMTAAEVAAAVSEHLPLKLRIATQAEVDAVPLSHLERVVGARVAHTAKYVSSPLEFSRRNLDTYFPGESPRMTTEVLDRIVEWFVENRMQRSVANGS